MKKIEKTTNISIETSFLNYDLVNENSAFRPEDGILDFLFPDLYKESLELSKYDIQLKIILTPKREKSKEEEEPTINIKLSQAVKEDKICNHLGLNPWCVAEGANGDNKVEIPISLAKEVGII